MKDYTVDDPKFSKKITITEITDTNHADNINKAPKQVFENTLFLEKSKVSANGGDVSDTIIQSAAAVEDEYPIPVAGDTPKTLLGKTKKFFESIKNWMTGVCLLGHIVNNCVTDNPNLPLSAAQGKALMDLYNVLNTKGKIYYASGSKNAEYKVETGLVELTVPAGKYLVLAANSVTTPKTGQMSCGLGASSGTLIGMNTTRTESTSGGGVVNFAYLDTDNISTIKTSGYGYNDESYMYRSILVAIRL